MIILNSDRRSSKCDYSQALHDILNFHEYDSTVCIKDSVYHIITSSHLNIYTNDCIPIFILIHLPAV